MLLLVMLLMATTAWAQHQPVGNVEITSGPMSVYVKGWAYDPDDEAAAVSVRVEVYDDEDCTEESATFTTNVLTANQATTDVAALNGITGNHGFEGYIETSNPSNKWVKVYAVDATDGDVQLGSKTQILVKKLVVGSGNIVTPENMDDILYGGSGVTFDNATNTLTLVNNEYLDFWPDANGIIIKANFDLNIAGSYHVTLEWLNNLDTNNRYLFQFVNCTGSLTFDGDFTFLRSRISMKPENAPNITPVVYAEGDVSIMVSGLHVPSATLVNPFEPSPQ